MPKTVSSRMLEVDLTGMQNLGKNTGDPSLNQAMRTMNQGLAMDMIGDFQDRMAYNRDVRNLERQKMNVERERALRGDISGPGARVDPAAEFMKGLSNPEYLKLWREMTPQERNELMMQVQQMSMMSRAGAAGMYGMMPWMMGGQMSGRRGDEISAKDLGNMFSTGMTTAIQAMTAMGGNKADPISLIGEIAKITEPFKALADTAQQRQYDLLVKTMERNTEGGGMSKALESMQKVLDVFGGGSTSSGDIEIAKIQSDSNYQMMTLQMQMNLETEKVRADQMKWEQAGGILMSGMAAVAPVVAKGIGALGERQGAASRFPQQKQQQPAGPQPEPYAVIRCSGCTKDFQVRLIGGAPPPSVQCPHCDSVLTKEPDKPGPM